MATDTALVVRNLLELYPFAGKTVVSVGAGGGQLVEYGREARKVIAVDQDAGALQRLAEVVRATGLASSFELVHADFFDVSERIFRAEQRFAGHAELLAKVSGQGPLAIARAERFRGADGIVIPFDYGVALL